MTTAVRTDLVADVWRALDTVRDPELDEPVTSLRFVASCEVSDGVAEVHLRLPTYFCAPNFAFLMVADAHEAIASVDGIREAHVLLDEHFASEAINRGVAAQAGFVGTFGDEAVAELDTLRADFIRRAVLAGTDRVCRPLVRAGRDPVGMTLGDVPPSDDLARLRARRAELGLPSGNDAPLLVDVETGTAIDADDAWLHLGRARLSRVNIEANSSICRGMLRGRYGIESEEDS